MTAYTDDDVTAGARALYDLDYIGGLSMVDYERVVEVALDAVAPQIAARAVEPYQKALAELRADFARVAVIAGQHNAGARAEQVNP